MKLKKKQKKTSATSTLAKEIIKQRFGHIPVKSKKFGQKIDKIFFKHEKAQKQSFDSCVSTSTKENIVGKFILDKIHDKPDDTPTSMDQILSHSARAFPPKFPSELQFLTWLHHKKTDRNNQNHNNREQITHEQINQEMTFFERNPLTWLQFHISVSQADCLICILDWREIDFYFEADLITLDKQIICVIGKIDLSDNHLGMCSFLQSCNNRITNGETPVSNEHLARQFKADPKYALFIQHMTTLNKKGILLFPFSSLFTDCNISLLNYLNRSEHKSFAMIGYPNVGKSTFLKFITKNQKIRISTTPGKTKYCQEYHVSHNHMKELFLEQCKTIDKFSVPLLCHKNVEDTPDLPDGSTISENIPLNRSNINNKTFYDVPGLVFKRHPLELLLFNNVLNIDQMKIDHPRLLEIVLKRVKLITIFNFYKILILKEQKAKKTEYKRPNLKRDFYKKQYEMLFGEGTPVKEDSCFHSWDEVHSANQNTNIHETLDKIENTLKKTKHWSIEIFFRKVVKDLFDGKIKRDLFR